MIVAPIPYLHMLQQTAGTDPTRNLSFNSLFCYLSKVLIFHKKLGSDLFWTFADRKKGKLFFIRVLLKRIIFYSY